MEHPLLRLSAPIFWSHGDKNAARPRATEIWIDQPADQDVLVPEIFRKIIRQMGGHHPHEIALSFELDPHGLADGATTVTAQEILGPHRVFFAGLTHLHRRGDTVRVLLTIDQLMPEADVAAQRFRSLLEQGLQPNLRQVGGAERARRDRSSGCGTSSRRHSRRRG